MSEQVFFTADTHFGDERTLELSRRPFACVSDMDNSMIERWNSTIAPDDIVYHLGDFGSRYEVAKKLHGTIRLLVGNYERKHLCTHAVRLPYLEELFEEVYLDTRHLLYLGDVDVHLALVHEPVHRMNGCFNLFGHIHQLQMVKRNGLNVGVDCHDFTPVSIETVLFYKNAIEHHYDENVFSV